MTARAQKGSSPVRSGNEPFFLDYFERYAAGETPST